MGKKRRKRINCPNCDTQLKEQMNYCPNCGQENHIKRVTLKMLFQDFFETCFTFDSKLWITLKALILKPAYLSKAYLNGEIVRYLPPIRLYIFISFMFFLLFNITNSNFLENVNVGLDTDKTSAKLEEESSLSYKKIANFLKKLAKENKTDKTDGANLELPGDLESKVLDTFTKEYEIRAFVGLMKSKLPFVFFVLIPVLAFLYFVLFYKKELFYVDHLVFILHFQSFIFLILTLQTLITWLFDIGVSILFSILSFVYVYIATKRFFNLKKWSIVWRLGVITFLYSVSTIFVFIGYFLIMLMYY